MTTRRDFLGSLGLGAAALLGSDPLIARMIAPDRYAPVRVTGRVHAGGRGIAGVPVTDGLSVTLTGDGGGFELVAGPRSRFVYMTLPAGCEIPVNQSGTARFYRPIAEVGGGIAAEFELRPLRISDSKHSFLAMADPQMQDEEEVRLMLDTSVPDIRGAVGDLDLRNPFGVSLGDIMYDHLELFPEYERAVSGMGIPCFQVIGNHDYEPGTLTDEAATGTFERFFGPRYYSFDRGEIHYVVLDDIFWFGGYIGYLDQCQLDWLAADLSLVERGRTVVVFMHIPVYCEEHVRQGLAEARRNVVIVNREYLYELLEPYRAYAVCGHLHQSEFLTDGGVEIHVCGALCGAWWTGSVCSDGTPRGYMVYEADGSDLRWRYKSTGLRIERQMRLYPPGTAHDRPEILIANVWGADRSWKILWYEDGDRRGGMIHGRGRDPLAVELYEGNGKPEKRPTVEPRFTDHLYFAVPSPGARRVTVEATDRWDRIYRESIDL